MPCFVCKQIFYNRIHKMAICTKRDGEFYIIWPMFHFIRGQKEMSVSLTNDRDNTNRLGLEVCSEVISPWRGLDNTKYGRQLSPSNKQLKSFPLPLNLFLRCNHYPTYTQPHPADSLPRPLADIYYNSTHIVKCFSAPCFPYLLPPIFLFTIFADLTARYNKPLHPVF